MLEALQQYGITLNKKKCEFEKEEIRFLGIIFSKSGVKPDPAKVMDLRRASQPKNREGVRSLLGMAEFNQRFVSGYTKITAPLGSC